MSYVPNRVNAGVSTGGQFAPKVNSEADSDLASDDYDEFDPERYENGGGVFNERHETLMLLEKDYLADVEANPTREGMIAASEKYGYEIKRFELAAGEGIADRSLYPPKEWWTSTDDLGLKADEMLDDDYCYMRVVMEQKAVDHINAIRNRELDEKYGKYNGKFPEGPVEVDISIRSDENDYSETVSRKSIEAVGGRGYAEKEGYEGSYEMFKAAVRKSYSSVYNLQHEELREAIHDSHSSGTGAAYKLFRSGYNRQAGKPEFNEVVIVPSQRETEKLDLNAPAIAEGWL